MTPSLKVCFRIFIDRESNLKARQCIKDTYKALGQNEHALSQGSLSRDKGTFCCCVTFGLIT